MINDVVSTQRQRHLEETRVSGASRHEQLLLEHKSGGGCGGGLVRRGVGAGDLVVTELGSQASVFVVRESNDIIFVARRRRFAVVVEVWPGARGKVGEHLFEEVVMGIGWVKVRVELVVVIIHLRVLDLVGGVVVVKVLKRNLRRVQERVDSLHFSATGLHNYKKCLKQKGMSEREI